MASDDPGVLIDPLVSRGAYQVNFNTSDMGLTDMVDPTKSSLIFEDITTGTTGKKNKIGSRFVGAKIIISVAFRQITLAMQQALSTWSTGAAVSMTPPLNSDMYDFSKSLVLHPIERGADTTMDLVYLHACCIKIPIMKRDNGSDDMVEVDFECYPDRAAMNTSSGAMNLSQGTIKGS